MIKNGFDFKEQEPTDQQEKKSLKEQKKKRNRMQVALSDLRSSEVAKRRLENVKALELKQRQAELESFRRSEAIEAARREQLRKQRHAEKLLQDAAEAAEKEEQEKLQAEFEQRERERQDQLETERLRIEKAKEEEKQRQIARAKQIKEAEEAAALVKARDEQRRQAEYEATASERMKQSLDRFLGKLHSTIEQDTQAMEADTASRRRQRQFANDAQSALIRIKALEMQLSKTRDRSRLREHAAIKKQEAENLDERFFLDGASPEEQRNSLLVKSNTNVTTAVAAGGGGAAPSGKGKNRAVDSQNPDGAQNSEDEDEETLRQQEQERQHDCIGGDELARNIGNDKKRRLAPLDFETWSKQREAEAELVALSLEYQMRTGGAAPACK